MCGLFGMAGIVDGVDGEDLVRLRAARDTLIHRGPDSQGEWFDANVYVGHTRLSILDLSPSGAQPMVADGVVMAANGEIYNYRELRQALASEFSFRSDSDSEVLVHGYRCWGIDGLLQRLEGMFAFVIYDANTGSVHLARDRVGIKPLYYSHQQSRLTWGSELKAIESYEETLEVDRTALYDFLTYRYVPTPKTLYTTVRKLEPGCVLSFDTRSGRLSRSRYWRLDASTTQPESPSHVDDVAALLADAVEAQQVADAPLGFFLSGGLDSSTVVGHAAAKHPRPQTFTIGFDDAAHSELGYAALMAEHAGTDHVSATLTEADAVDLIPSMRTWFDEPFADTSALPTFLVSRLAAQSVKVVLTGDGGDEVFGGYDWYQRFARRRGVYGGDLGMRALAPLKRWGGVPRRAVRALERYLLLSGLPYYTRLLGGLIANEKTLYRDAWEIPADYDDYWHFRDHYDESLPLITRLQVLDFHTYLPDDILTKVDRVSMANSLEARVPLLSTPLIEAVFSLPANLRGADKQLLKTLSESILPPTIIQREKKGFGVPAATWSAGVFDRSGGAGRSGSRQENLLLGLYPEFSI